MDNTRNATLAAAILYLAADNAEGRIVIISREPGFRRAGIAHPARAEYPLGRFTAAELEQLLSEPTLAVEVIGVPPEALLRSAGAGITFAHPLTGADREAIQRAESAGRAMAVGSPDAGIEAQAARDLAEQQRRSGSHVHSLASPEQVAVTEGMIEGAAETLDAGKALPPAVPPDDAPPETTVEDAVTGRPARRARPAG
ncbi:MAG: HI1506-related protein [Roseomonas mucosa]|nr:HI1506-related protein [Roseomonas mucosa]